MDSLSALPTAPGDPNPAAARIIEQAEGRLRCHRYRVLRVVSCMLRDGVLVLHGHLPTYYLKQIAQEAVAGIPGVRHVENRIDVVPPSTSPATRRPGTGRRDAARV